MSTLPLKLKVFVFYARPVLRSPTGRMQRDEREEIGSWMILAAAGRGRGGGGGGARPVLRPKGRRHHQQLSLQGQEEPDVSAPSGPVFPTPCSPSYRAPMLPWCPR